MKRRRVIDVDYESKKRTVGDVDNREVEVRYFDVAHKKLDEICARDAHVHLEMMDYDHYSLIIETRKERACFLIGSVNGRSHVNGSEFWRDKLNRRSEAAKRRENAKKFQAGQSRSVG